MWYSAIALPLILFGHVASTLAFPVSPSAQRILAPSSDASKPRRDAKVLILGGGVAGIIAARTLHEQGISDFIIVEARGELGGRLTSHTFGARDHQYTVEVGANWVQGTQTGDGAENPIWTLVKKHNVSTQSSNYFTSLTTYDDTGPVEYLEVFNRSVVDFARLVASAGTRVPTRLVDMTARSGYSLTGAQPETRYERASEYYQFDWEFGTTPEETSWLASSWVHVFAELTTSCDGSEQGLSR